ncbi:MAG TPA: protein kinase [Pyrinomonadaceae bacterium]|nr:protein kinase [Pyrinomonadaceae bacterium]
MLSTDTVLQGRYQVVRQLGQGGMGAVYEAVDERLDTTVALKETLFTDEKLRKQFEREARLLARLHHQALPRVSDHFNEGEGQFLVMQYIAGEDLAAMLAARNGPFPQDEVLRWADQLCDALDYLHTQDPQIIHRDIKPQNLKLTARGQIVLLDFGLAKGSAGQLTAVTTSASIFGYTPNYAPLEQVQGMGTDARSDIYSLAATLFHLATNVKPPDALSRAAAVVNGDADPLPLANLISANVSSSFANVLSKAMSLKRDERFASASAMREALRVAADHPLADAATLLAAGAAAVPASSTLVGSERSTRLVGGQTQRGGAPSLASEAQTLVAGEVTSVREPVSAAKVQPARTSRAAWAGAVVLLVIIVGAAAAFFTYRNRNRSTESAAPPLSTDSQPTQPSESAGSPAPGATSSQSGQVKVNEARTQSSKTESQRGSTKKSESQQKAETVPIPQTPATGEPQHDPNRNPNRTGPPSVQPPRIDPYQPAPGKEGHPPIRGLPEVRTLPNGGKVIKQPDGTFIFIGPKGQTKVVTPRERPRNSNSNSNHP